MIYNNETNTVTTEWYIQDNQINTYEDYILPHITKISQQFDWLPTITRIKRFGSRIACEREFVNGIALESMINIDDYKISAEDIYRIYNNIHLIYFGLMNNSYQNISNNYHWHLRYSYDFRDWFITKKGNLKYVSYNKINPIKGLPVPDLQSYAFYSQYIADGKIADHQLFKQEQRAVKEKQQLLDIQKRKMDELFEYNSNSIHKDKLKQTFGINLYKQMGFPQVFGDDDES